MTRLGHLLSGRGRLALLLAFALLLPLGLSVVAGDAAAQSGSLRLDDESAAATGPTDGGVPGYTRGLDSDADIWRDIRHGAQGRVAIPDAKAGIMVQSEGEQWQALRMGPLQDYSGWALLGTIVLLAAFFALRGRIRIDHGKAGTTVERFKGIERFGHWLLAISFIVLTLTGLNLLFGRDLILPLLGPEVFAAITLWGKIAHNYVAFAFMAGLVLIFLMWVVHNLPSVTDLKWLAMGGGVLIKGVHPPAKKFNAGQKLIFWSVILGGLSLSLSGWALLFPFETYFFTDTFEQLNAVGIDAAALLGLPPPPYEAIMEQQLNQIWHVIMAVAMTCIILAHIYIGSVGMEGAFDAMGSGQVDKNWAQEHHSIWAEEVEAKARAKGLAEPAE
ncbi:MAG: formate dehydrogenase subunit gamma [Rhodospirillales bacterium]|nr:formate dehydrogenase subunit gamma [Rhodospirillales bacterium]